MKIDSSQFTALTLPSTTKAAPKAPETAARSEAVSLSSLASALQGNERPTVNTARIQEIKEAIAQGHFKIDPEAIADGLLQTARDLVNSQRKA
ncbi:MAG: flagellar biosynthesis anti-sigma factor FlgM [Dechloromonas sp.]|nr:flagellar biosynthesis anti-sigma factor FlgM [Dechloromonas sp.]